ncbi:DUF5677 domain-containing protein [Saccharibacillus endophyticus]|uniref:AbiV family abortive infection protein n=1 Tax=Saccharibacillus endophyticus TaxID=2060666 RepID=A0ABQ1ZYX2_9BACL|nr:DUF5677 domain-containing protein [Saccharibacillus endophyticus]GGH80202.1 hypothetical protein GCM10007362_28150 [Saccharibacillus endophyticus]
MKIKNVHQLLEYCISFAEEELNSFLKNSNNKAEESIIVAALYRSILELSLSAKISAENGLRVSNELNYRSFLEHYLTLKYILKDAKKFKRRATAYKVSYHLIQIESAALLMDTYEELGIDKEQMEEIRKMHIEIIEQPEYASIRNEYERMKRNSKYKQYPKWYSLNNGPTSVNQLIKASEDDPRFMKYLYGSLSQSAHGYLALRDWHSKGLLPLQAKVDPNEDNFNLGVFASFLATSTQRFIIAVHPEHKLKLERFYSDYISAKTELGLM